MENKKQVRKKAKSKQKFLFLLVLISIILLVGIFVFLSFSSKEPLEEKKKVEVIDHLEDYGYILNDNESTYYNQLFKDLKETLNRKDYTEEEYATLVVRLFVADFFHLENKLTKSDIGGTQFVYEPYRIDFENYAKEGLYKYIDNNIYGNREQELPSVEQVSIDKIEQKEFEYDGTTDLDAYYVNVTIQFNKDLGYKNTYQVVLIHNENKLELAKLS